MSKPIDMKAKSYRAREVPEPGEIVLVPQNVVKALSFNSGQGLDELQVLYETKKQWIGIDDLVTVRLSSSLVIHGPLWLILIT